MTTNYIIHSIIDILLIVALAIGFIYEDKLIAFEDRLIEKIKNKGAQR